MTDTITMMTRPEREYYRSLGERIRAAREHAGLTQRELGVRIGVSHVSIHRWETAGHRPSAFTIRRLGRIFGEEWG